MSSRKQDRPLSARLAALSEALPAAKQRERECELAHRRAEADVARLRDAVIDAHSDGDEQRAAKASRERDKAEQVTLRDAEERLEGAKRAVAKAEAERGLYAAENVDGLIAERQPDARAAAQAVEDAVEELGRAHAVWSGVESDVAALLRVAGRNPGALPRFPELLANLVRDARRAGVSAFRCRCRVGRRSRRSCRMTIPTRRSVRRRGRRSRERRRRRCSDGSAKPRSRA
jgi:hypothetical protein